MIEFREDPVRHQIEIVIQGKITKQDFDEIKDTIKRRFAEWDNITLLEQIKDFEGMELGAWWQDFKLGSSLVGKMGHLKKCAVVGDETWLKASAKLADFFIKADVRSFPEEELIEAKKWLDARY